MNLRIEQTIPTVQQWMALRESVGWSTFPASMAQKSLDATPYCVCAFEQDVLVGMGRVLGDGVFTFYIGNVMVRPEYQNQGIGKKIMEQIMSYLRENAAPGAIANLMSIQGKENFYQQFGFTVRPDESNGAGMSLTL